MADFIRRVAIFLYYHLPSLVGTSFFIFFTVPTTGQIYMHRGVHYWKYFDVYIQIRFFAIFPELSGVVWYVTESGLVAIWHITSYHLQNWCPRSPIVGILINSQFYLVDHNYINLPIQFFSLINRSYHKQVIYCIDICGPRFDSIGSPVPSDSRDVLAILVYQFNSGGYL